MIKRKTKALTKGRCQKRNLKKEKKLTSRAKTCPKEQGNGLAPK